MKQIFFVSLIMGFSAFAGARNIVRQVETLTEGIKENMRQINEAVTNDYIGKTKIHKERMQLRKELKDAKEKLRQCENMDRNMDRQ